jgi:GntR family transcriptional regulator
MTESAYQRLYRVLRDQILEGEYAPGERLPTERELCEQFGVSRITTRHALHLLEEQGLVERLPRRGTIVRRRRPVKVPIVDGDYAGSIHKQLNDVTRRIVFNGTADPPSYVRDVLGLLNSEACHVAERLDVSGGHAIAHDRVFFPKSYGRRLTEDLLTSVDFLSRWLDEEGLDLSHIHERIEARIPDERTAELLDLSEHSAVLLTVEAIYGGSGSALMIVETYYNSDRWQLVTTMQGSVLPRH